MRTRMDAIGTGTTTWTPRRNAGHRSQQGLDSVAPFSRPASPILILLGLGSVESRSGGVSVTLMEASAKQ